LAWAQSLLPLKPARFTAIIILIGKIPGCFHNHPQIVLAWEFPQLIGWQFGLNIGWLTRETPMGFENSEPNSKYWPLDKGVDKPEDAQGQKIYAEVQELEKNASICRQQISLPLAVDFLENSLDKQEKLYGSGSKNLEQTLDELSSVYMSQRRYGKAEPLYFRLADMEASGPYTIKTSLASRWENLADCLMREGKNEEAQKYLLKALNKRQESDRELEAAYPSANLSPVPTAYCMVMLGNCLELQGKRDAARIQFSHALSKLGDEWESTSTARNAYEGLSRVSLLDGDWKRACGYVRKAFQVGYDK
jgi:tetratricopeptide (TPR) repeat protein